MPQYDSPAYPFVTDLAADDRFLFWQDAEGRCVRTKLETIANFVKTTGNPLTIAALKALDVSSLTMGAIANVGGYYAVGDGGGGLFYYDSGSSATTNSGTVFQPNSGPGRWLRILQGKSVALAWFGAKSDGSTDDSAAVQLAINYCATFSQWPCLIVNGKTLLGSTVNIDRAVDTTTSEFRIIGNGSGAGFYTTGNVIMFSSTLPAVVNPSSEFVTFEGIEFESSAFGNASYVLSQHFLRIKFINCFFRLIRCQLSPIYAQTLYFNNCNIRNNPSGFINSVGLYDVSFNSCIIENGYTIVRCENTARGANGLRFINNVIEGIQESIVVARGANGFDLIGNHLEGNYSPEFNFFGVGALMNGTINVVGNYIYNPAGATMYYGPTTAVFSSGNTASPSLLHSNAVQVVNLISVSDKSAGGISDATTYSVVNGVYCAGNTTAAWTDSGNQLNKSASGEFAFGFPVQPGFRAFFAGPGTTSATYSGAFCNASGFGVLVLRDDREALLPSVREFANDVDAAAGGVPITGIYRTGSVLKFRVS